jgi:hypothetical protein
VAAAVAAPMAHQGPAASAQSLSFVQTWAKVLPDAGHPIGLSSPNVATLGGQPAVVVGDRAGYIYAFDESNGAPVSGWPASTGGIPVDSTPSVAVLSAGSSDDTVFVGVGNSATPSEGGYEAFNPDGTRLWYVPVKNPSSDRAAGATSAVMASLSVGDLQGKGPDVVAPSVGQEEYAIDAATGAVLPGFPWFTADSGFSTPALADVYGNGQLDIIEGGDQTAGLAYGVTYSRGGHLRVLSPTGNAGTDSPTGGLQCEYNPDQGVQSSPAVGRFLSGGAIGIVVGTSHEFSGAPDSDKLIAFGTHCDVAWEDTLDGATEGSPALADLDGPGGPLDVVEGTDAGPGHGSVYALDGATGAVIWRTEVGEVIGSVVTADLGEGYQDVVVPTTSGASILDGRSGQVVATLEKSLGLQNAPLVTEGPDGTIGITLAGYNGHNAGEIEHFELPGSDGAHVDEPGAWPMFHHDPQLTGNADVTTADVPAASGPEGASDACQPPPGGPNGYYEMSSDGRVFAYGNVADCGEALGRKVAGPLVGLAATADGGGYWLADATGQVWAFGDAKAYQRSAAGTHPPRPVVAITATPDSRGYWLVDQAGQVWGFGDAKVYKAASAVKGEVTAMAATADGHGYWLATATGAVYAYGDAVARPAPAHAGSVSGIAADTATGGYWLVNTRGQIYALDAPVYGSVPPSAHEKAVSGIVAAPGGTGYRLVDSGGALFCFGVSTALGTALAAHPARPVVAIAAP